MLSRALSLAALAILIGGYAIPAAAQNLDAGKSPSQLFSSTCSLCHKSARGMLKNVAPGALPGFLRQHYTTSTEMAGVLSAYVLSNGATDRRAGDNLTRQGRGDGESSASPQEGAKGRKSREASRPDADGLETAPDSAASPKARSKSARDNAKSKAAKGEPPKTEPPKDEPKATEEAKPDIKPEAKPETDQGAATAKLEPNATPEGPRPDPVPAVTPAPAAPETPAAPPVVEKPAPPPEPPTAATDASKTLTVDISPPPRPPGPAGPPAGPPVPPISQ